jgi:succinate dehydrogenase / fumarate reductase iron-sulfur subunit
MSMTLKLKVWRQEDSGTDGKFEDHDLTGVNDDMSFLEMLDVLNEQLIEKGDRPVEFESDCREGICGTCNMVINGQAHGPQRETTACQLHMRSFKDGDTITIEPWRAKAFPVIKDLVVDRTALDRIIQSGGYVSAHTGPHPDANSMPIPKPDADEAFNYATCIGCGACVASCPNASASLFTSAKIAQMSLLPQGRVEQDRRVVNMVETMETEGFGNCTNIGECQAACPKGISIESIRIMKRDYLKAVVTSKRT